MPAPVDVHLALADVLDGAGAGRRAAFDRRLDDCWTDLLTGLAAVYPEPDALARRLVRLAAEAYAVRESALHDLDERRQLEPDWLQQPRMFGYACYTDRFAGDLRGMSPRLDYLGELGVTYLHLMPLLQPRPGDNDGGYAVQDFRTVRADLGTNDDLRALAADLRGRGISLVLDLVLNHVAREHAWAAAARAGDATYRDYFVVFPDRTEPDAYEETLPDVFPDFAPGSFSWDADLDGWVWTTFNEWQWDLNWANPEVFCEFASIVLHLANLGVEVLRLDAIAFLWKRKGTNCQNQPEVHSITQALRAVARLACPAVAFKAEAIVGPRDLVQYLGTGEHVGRVSDLAYHNSLMVQGWSMLASRDTVLARHALAALPPKPASGTWITYARCHDDIGWAIDDHDAAAVGLDGYLHRRFLSDWYAGEFPDSWAHGLVFQHNPATGDKRISGTAASLVGLGYDRSDGAEDDAAFGRFLLVHTLMAGWGGLPVIWSGDELGQLNDPAWADEPGHEDDNRWAHRPRLDWSRAELRHDPATLPGRVFQALAHLARVRAALPQLHAAAPTEVLLDTDPGVLATVRNDASGPLVCLYNVTSEPRPFHLAGVPGLSLRSPHEAISDRPVEVGDDGVVLLPGYAAWWVTEGPALRPGD